MNNQTDNWMNIQVDNIADNWVDIWVDIQENNRGRADNQPDQLRLFKIKKNDIKKFDQMFNIGSKTAIRDGGLIEVRMIITYIVTHTYFKLKDLIRIY